MSNRRPELNNQIEPSVFLNFYWLKTELQQFCRQLSIPVSGSKQELTDRIYTYLSEGTIKKVKGRGRVIDQSINDELGLEAIIQPGYRSDERHRAFFKEKIGTHFKFNVPFMNWMNSNAGSTYREAIEEWHRIDQAKRAGEKFDIGNQFEYNQYMRDFFSSNPEQSRQSAIKCWREKRSRPGSNKYEESDLQWLNNQSS